MRLSRVAGRRGSFRSISSAEKPALCLAGTVHGKPDIAEEHQRQNDTCSLERFLQGAKDRVCDVSEEGVKENDRTKPKDGHTTGVLTMPGDRGWPPTKQRPKHPVRSLPQVGNPQQSRKEVHALAPPKRVRRESKSDKRYERNERRQR